jgi:hypothetical protein
VKCDACGNKFTPKCRERFAQPICIVCPTCFDVLRAEKARRNEKGAPLQALLRHMAGFSHARKGREARNQAYVLKAGDKYRVRGNK